MNYKLVVLYEDAFGNYGVETTYPTPNEMRKLPDFSRDTIFEYLRESGRFANVLDFEAMFGFDHIPMKNSKYRAITDSMLSGKDD